MRFFTYNKLGYGSTDFRNDGIGRVIVSLMVSGGLDKRYYTASTNKTEITDDFTRYKRYVKTVNKKSCFIMDMI